MPLSRSLYSVLQSPALLKLPLLECMLFAYRAKVLIKSPSCVSVTRCCSGNSQLMRLKRVIYLIGDPRMLAVDMVCTTIFNRRLLRMCSDELIHQVEFSGCYIGSSKPHIGVHYNNRCTHTQSCRYILTLSRGYELTHKYITKHMYV